MVRVVGGCQEGLHDDGERQRLLGLHHVEVLYLGPEVEEVLLDEGSLV